MSTINLPPEQRESIKAVDIDLLDELVDRCLHDERLAPLTGLRLGGCGGYVSGKLRIFEQALLAYAKAKSFKKREETEQDARRAGSAFIAAVQQMQGQVETAELDDQLFFVEDTVGRPLIYSSQLSVCVSFRWREASAQSWDYGHITFLYNYEPAPSYLSPPPRRKPSAAERARTRETELYREWEQLRRDALHAVKEFFRQGGQGGAIPETFRVKLAFGGGLDNFSTRFWIGDR